jgi:uncharacterized membrane protein YfcA
VLESMFALLLAWVAVSMIRRREPAGATAQPVPPPEAEGGAAVADRPAGDPPAGDAPATGAPAAEPTFTDSLSGDGYHVRRLPMGMAGSVFAGLVSALLGVGGGIVKVPVMNLVMGVPLKVATATSNMMIGITATSSAVIYLLRDQVDPFVAGPVAIGVFGGAMIGTRIAHRVDVRLLRWLFVAVLVYTSIEMGMKAVGL